MVVDVTRLELRLFGLPVSVEVPNARYETLRAQWSWCLPDAHAQRSIDSIGVQSVERQKDISVSRDDAEDDGDGHTADYRLTTTLTGQAINACAGALFMFHAAGVADPISGKVAGLIAPSGTGKTTASRALCTRGYGYVTDETLIFNDVGDVLPYPKPLSVIIGDLVGQKSQHGPDELGFTPLPDGPLTLGPLVVLDRAEDTVEPRLEPMSVFEGLMAVLPQSSAVPLVPDALERIAELARRGGGFHRLAYTEISDAIDVLHTAFTTTEAERDWIHVPGNWPDGDAAPSRYGHTAAAAVADPPTAHTRYERGLFVDALTSLHADEALVLVGDLPAHLLGVGAQIWALLETPRGAQELTERCVAIYGDHPQADQLTLDALVQLEESGVVRRLPA